MPYFCFANSWACKHPWLFKIGALVKSEVSSKPSPLDRMVPSRKSRPGVVGECRGQLRGFGLGRSPLQGPALRPCLWGSRTRRGPPALPRHAWGLPCCPPERALGETPGVDAGPHSLSQWLLHCSGEAPRVVRSSGPSRGRWWSRRSSPEPGPVSAG